MKLPPHLKAAVLARAGPAPDPPAPPLDSSEKEFQARVVELAGARGWLTFHVVDSRKCKRGFPDLVLVRPLNHQDPGDRGLVFAELKKEDGDTRPEQRTWLAALMNQMTAGSVLGVFVWRPSDWEQIKEVLSRCGSKSSTSGG
jgi:hypothetical protein